ncbi:MAG: choice-of-anchor D domain-containing protein [Myxococcaceae bacterium]|nr:choice-of-anchor D domain-containing protein [Myxococcaceae bacterium]
MALVGVTVAVGCAERQYTAPAESLPSIEPRVVDFGRVPIFAGREVDVTVINNGRAELELMEVWTEGPQGAFRVRLDQGGPHRVVSGGSSPLKLRFSPQAGGSAEGKLVVRTNSGLVPLSRVVLKGEGVDATSLVKPDQLDFGRIEAQTSKTLSFSVENPADIPTWVRVRTVGADADEFSAPETLELAAYERRELPVTWAPPDVGRKQVALAVTPCTGCRDVVVRVAAEALDRAVIAEPSPVIFGQTPMDRSGARKVLLRNLSTEPQEVLAAALAARTDPGFLLPSVVFPQVLAPAGTLEVELRFSPGHMGEAGGQLDFSLRSVRNPTLPVGLQGYGGAPEVCVSPAEHDFGELPVGSKTGLTVNVKNCGTNNASPITLTRLFFDPGPGGAPVQFSVAPQQLPVTLPAGGEVNLRVFFEPTAAGAHEGTFRVQSSGVTLNETPVVLRGRARQYPPCQVRITPAQLDFGTVPSSAGAVLGVKVEHLDGTLCAVKNIGLVNDGGGVFSMPGGHIDGLLMWGAGEAFSFMVAFNAPAQGGAFTGLLRLEVADPAAPVRDVPIIANSQTSCLVAVPNYVEFGVAWPECPPVPRQVQLVNGCSAAVGVGPAVIGAGTTDGEFMLTQGLPAQVQLQPGQAATLEVTYAAQAAGMNLSPLYVPVTGLAAPLLVPLIGESSRRMDQTDRFVQTDGNKVDVLFVVDNTASMVEEHPRLVAALPAFAETAQRRGVDLRAAITTTGIEPVSSACPGGAQGGEAGRFAPVDGARPRVLTSSMGNLATLLQQNADVGQCALVEQGFEAMRRALTPPLVNNADDPRTPTAEDGNIGFLRDEAALAVLFVGDEDDHSPDSPATYVQFLRALKGVGQPQRMGIWAIAPGQGGCSSAGGAGDRYAEAAQLTGGAVLSVCAGDYRPLLQQVAEKAFSPQDRFALGNTPDPSSIVVRMDGAVVPPAGWDYSAADNSVVFVPQPAPGARIEVQYRRVCGR